MANKPTRIIWHHTADTSPDSQAAKINLAHQARGFPISSLGFYGGYHLLIEKDGSIFRYRADEEIGAHAFNHNQDTLGVALAGNFSIEHPNTLQLTSFVNVLRQWLHIWALKPNDIVPHRSVRQTECPGLLLTNDLPQQMLAENSGYLIKQRTSEAAKAAITYATEHVGTPQNLLIGTFQAFQAALDATP